MNEEIKKSLLNDITSKIEEVKSANEENLKKHDALHEEKIRKLSEALANETKRLDSIEAEASRPAISDSKAENLEAEAKNFELLGKKVDVEEVAKYKSAFEKFLRAGGSTGILEPIDQKALQVGNDNAGGFFVRPELSNVIIEKSFDTSPIRKLANIETISTDAFEEIVDFDDFDAEFIAELATRNTTANTTFSKLRIEAEEVYAKPLISNKMLEDSAVNMESYIINKLANKFARKEATAFVNGSGVGEPKGLLSYADGSKYGTVQQVETANSLDLKPDDLLNLAGQLKSAYHSNGTFLMSRITFFSKVLTFKDGAGDYIFDAFRDPKGGRIVFSILGYPVEFADDMVEVNTSTAFTAGQLPIMFGDFRRAYTIVDRMGISVLRDPYTQDGAVKFSARKRVGGAASNTEAYKILKIKA